MMTYVVHNQGATVREIREIHPTWVVMRICLIEMVTGSWPSIPMLYHCPSRPQVFTFLPCGSTTESVSALSLFVISFITSISSLPGNSFSDRYLRVRSSSTTINISSFCDVNISTNNWPGIFGSLYVFGIPGMGSGCSHIKCESVLYFQIVRSLPESVGGHSGQWIGTFVHGVLFDGCRADL